MLDLLRGPDEPEIHNSSSSSTNTSTSTNDSDSSSDNSTPTISSSSSPPPAAARISKHDLTSTDFTLVRRIGAGDIGTVYLCKLQQNQDSEFAIKVVDKDVLKKKNKIQRAETEARILKLLDHPFLPKLVANFDANERYSCVVMEYCSGGDLHSLRHRQPHRRFSVNAARFYAAEVVLALEYLHMLGIVYRDLKPENILIRSDGHIMLTDFDLSLESTSLPTLEMEMEMETAGTDDGPPSCLPVDRIFFRSTRRQHRRFVAEPVLARSNSFVGTHEYVAPEVASGCQHGSAVDWWAYGVFLFEILYGKTPFVGQTNEATLKNIIKKPLEFDECGLSDSAAARDLIARLLVKDPANRLGSRCGAADVKGHPFFKGLNFALLRSCTPPVVPGLKRVWLGKDEGKKPDRLDFF